MQFRPLTLQSTRRFLQRNFDLPILDHLTEDHLPLRNHSRSTIPSFRIALSVTPSVRRHDPRCLQSYFFSSLSPPHAPRSQTRNEPLSIGQGVAVGRSMYLCTRNAFMGPHPPPGRRGMDCVPKSESRSLCVVRLQVPPCAGHRISLSLLYSQSHVRAKLYGHGIYLCCLPSVHRFEFLRFQLNPPVNVCAPCAQMSCCLVWTWWSTFCSR